MASHHKSCVVCGDPFEAPPSSKKITCSRECSSIRKRRSHIGKSNTWSNTDNARIAAKRTRNHLIATKAAQASPLSGPFETNINAKDWIVRSPDGLLYPCRNLRHWCRTNADLFAPRSWQAAYVGLRQVAASYRGKTPRPVTQWFGWTLIVNANEG